MTRTMALGRNERRIPNAASTGLTPSGSQTVTATANRAVVNLPKKSVNRLTTRPTTLCFEENPTACDLLLRTELHR